MRNLKRTLSLVMAMALIVGMMVVSASAVSSDFNDSAEITNTEAVDVMTAIGVFEGTDKGAFNPTGILTREQAAKIVAVMLLGEEDANKLSTNSTTFKDVAANRWSAGYIGYCVQQGILAGTGNGNFDPEGLITRQAAAAMVVRAAQLCGLDTSLSASEITQTLASYPDGSLVSSYARQPFAYCCRTAILSGSELEPLRPILRCEIAQMLYNLLLQTPLLK